MSESLTPSPEQLHRARGVFGFVKTLGASTERFFRRLYSGLDSQSGINPQLDKLLQRQRELESALRLREAEAAHLNAILHSIGEGVIMQDTEGRMIMMNDAALELIGSQKTFWNSGLGRLFINSLHQGTLQSEFELIGDPVQVEVNNRVLAAQVAVVADSESNRLGSVIVLRDVTRAAVAERMRHDFITQVSHELRTPLTAIKGMSDVLTSQPPDRPPNRRFLEAISRNVDVLDRMIVELLDITEIGAGTFVVKREELQLDDLIWSVIRGLRSRWERAGLEIHFQPKNNASASLMGDNRRLRWAVGHLLENSINYTQQGGQITVRLGEIKRNRILTQITDTGVGISEVDLPHIFERFYRGKARTADDRLIDPRGLGQGLFVARAVAEAHNGSLGVVSKEGLGTTFTLALPLTDEPPVDEKLDTPIVEPPIDPEDTVPNPRLALPPEEDT